MRLYVACAVALLVAGCDDANGNQSVDATPPADARDPATCDATSPRPQPTETFVGPTVWQSKVAALIDSAQSSLDVQMYLFTIKDLATRISNAKARGVTVRVLLDPDEAGNSQVTPILTSGGVTWKNASSVYTFSHAKYVIVDKTTAVIMSMNFNTTASTNERNYGMVDKDPFDVADLQKIFDFDWQLANGVQATAPDLTCTRLIVSPVNAYQRINALIASANSTLDIEVLYITDTTIRNAVGAAKTRGANVRVILEQPGDQPSNTDTAAFFKNLGIPVKYAYDSQFYVHAKLIIADGVAFVGSENMSPTSLKNNRETGALVAESSEVTPIQNQFNSDWNITTPVP